jgi:hypothetical protein
MMNYASLLLRVLHRRLVRLVDRRGAEQTIKSLRRTVPDLERNVFLASRGRVARGMLPRLTALARRWVGDVTTKLGRILGVLSEETAAESARALLATLGAITRRALRVADGATVRRVVAASRETLLRAHAESSARYGARTLERIEDALRASARDKSTPRGAARAVADAAELSLPDAERIVVTEGAYAFNRAAVDAALEARGEQPDLLLQWTEVCEPDGRPADERTAVDSIAMHGQVAVPGEEFTCPADAPFPDARGRTQVPAALVGGTWEHPPNRPNDRAVLVPWDPSWGVPGWRLDGGWRVPVAGPIEPARGPRLGTRQVGADDFSGVTWHGQNAIASVAGPEHEVAKASIRRVLRAGVVLPPIRIAVSRSGGQEIVDGRHRMAVLSEPEFRGRTYPVEYTRGAP